MEVVKVDVTRGYSYWSGSQHLGLGFPKLERRVECKTVNPMPPIAT